MKNLHQNLLVVLAIGLCGLCAWQWYSQTLQRNQLDALNQLLNQKLAAIEQYTNSIRAMDGQIGQMDARITELKGTVKTNEQVILDQKREFNALDATNSSLTLQVAEYKEGVQKLEQKLKEAYEGIQKQNDAIKELAAQRDEFVQKLNASVKDRNDIVGKYNQLAAEYEKLQGGSKSSGK
jgi:chromosome segregation ATPase